LSSIATAGVLGWCSPAGTDHADHIGEMLSSFGVSNVVLHSKRDKLANDNGLSCLESWRCYGRRIHGDAHNRREQPSVRPYRDVAPDRLNRPMGADARPRHALPLRARLRPQPTVSSGFAPLRKAASKIAWCWTSPSNLPRLGPINDPIIPRLKNKGPPGDAPVRICEECGTYNHASARYCLACGYEFKFAPKIMSKAGTGELVRSDLAAGRDVRCSPSCACRTLQSRRIGYRSPSIEKVSNGLKACYYCGLRTFYEYVNFEAKTPLCCIRLTIGSGSGSLIR
jgi:hypothetical protein